MAIDIAECKYDQIRGMVFEEISCRTKKTNTDGCAVLGQSEYWADFCDFFRYVYYLPEWELRRIRRHTFHLTSDLYQRYYFADKGFKSLIENGYHFFIDQLEGFQIDEGTQGIGIKVDGQTLSHDLLRYLGVLVDLVKADALGRNRSKSEAQSILEIGGGYGGLARCIQKYKPNAAYVIVDLEETLFFSMCYLKEQLPEKQLYLVNNSDALRLEPNSVYFVPQHRVDMLDNLRFDLTISQQSLQEMTATQVQRYLNWIHQHCDHFYSCNINDHGVLASEKQIVKNLTGILENIFGPPIWSAPVPAENNRFGDSHLPRFVFRCHPA